MNVEVRARAKYIRPSRQRLVFVSIFSCAAQGARVRTGWAAGLKRRYGDGFAYVKIEARILARAQCGKVSRLFSSRRTFLRWLSRSALVLSWENVLSLAGGVWAKSGRWRGPQSTNSAAAQNPSPPASNGLDVSFVNVARESGLNVKTIFGGEHKNKYLLETTGCGVAFYDYDNYGWLVIFLRHGSPFGSFAARHAPSST